MPAKLKPTIADVVRSEAIRQGVSQRELARLIRVDASDLNRWLTGRRSIRVAYAERAMAYLGIRLKTIEED